MKKGLFFFLLLFISIFGFSQCPVSVQITPNLINPVCRGTDVLLSATPSVGVVTPQYFWIVDGDTVGTGISYTTTADFEFVELIMVTTTGCTNDIASTDYTVINYTMVADYNVLGDVECNQTRADVEVLGVTANPPGNEPYTYDFISGDGSLGQQELYLDLNISTYPIEIRDGNGCIDTTWIVMDVKQCDPVTPLEVITPNDDGINDTWIIISIEDYPENEVFIFDRWGQRVYHKKGYDNTDGWNVKYIGSNLPVTTYYYVLKIENEKSDDIVLKGAVSVFR